MTSLRARYALVIPGLLVLGLLGLTGACGSPAQQATPTPTKTPRPAATAAPVAVATSVPTPVLEAPTATPAPPTPTPEPTPTGTPTPTDTPTPAGSDRGGGSAEAYVPVREAGVSIFTGLRPADPAVLDRRPLAIKVDNCPEVVPQSGLDKADIVVDTHKEGCFLRFTAIYQSETAPRVGSMRSARLIDLELPAIFDAILMYSGAVGPVLQKLNQSDLGGQFITTASGGALFRDPDIAVPFNLFANTAAAWTAVVQRGWNTTPNPSLATVFSEAPPAGGGAAQTIDIPAPSMGSAYFAQLRRSWTYDAGSGRWLRSQGGKPHVDAVTGQQLSAANVILLGANHVKTLIPEQGTVLDQSACGNASIEIQLWGEGPAKVLRDGKVYEGKWVRPARRAAFRFVDAAGNDIPLKPGNSWWQVVPLDLKVTIAP